MLHNFLQHAKFADSGSKAKRYIPGRGVKVNGAVAVDPNFVVNAGQVIEGTYNCISLQVMMRFVCSLSVLGR